MGNGKQVDWPKICGKAIFWAALQAALASVLLSSEFSIKNFSKDQETLQNAADALYHYLVLAVIWALGSMLILYSSYSWNGLIAAFLANAIIIGWIYYTYVKAFQHAVAKHGLQYPKILW